MADIICPKCNKPNPNTLQICQFCGTPLKNHDTEPLPTIHPGEMPVKQKTSELENTLPGWLRDIRKGQSEGSTPDAPQQPSQPQKTEPPASPTAPGPSALDFLAGLSQSNEEEAVPDWLSSLKSDLPPITATPSGAAPAAKETESQPTPDWLTELHEDTPPLRTPAEDPANAWAFKDSNEPAAQPADETPDWLAELKAQDTTNIPAQPTKPADVPLADTPADSDDLPDWLAGLQAEAAPAAPPPQPPAPPAASSPPSDDFLSGGDLPNWLSDAPQQPVSPEPAPTGSSPVVDESSTTGGELPDWLAGLQAEAAPAPGQPAAPVTPAASEEPSSGGEFPDWLANLGGESVVPAPSQPAAAPAAPAMPAASEDLSSDGEFPDWLAGLGAEPAKPAPTSEQASPVEKKPEQTPPSSTQKKAFSTGVLNELNSLGTSEELPDWMAGLASAAPAKAPEAEAATPSSDTFDWLGGLSQGTPSPLETEPKPTGKPEPAQEKPEAAPVSFDISSPETPSLPPLSDQSSVQNIDSIFSMEMPDWLSGFTPSEPEPAKPASEQPGPFTGNLSPGDLPSWVQAMRPIESLVPGTESGDEDQTVEKEGPLAGLRSVLPAQANALGQRKPKAYSIKLQVDPTQLSQATLLENLIASEAESRPVALSRRVVNIRPLRWVVAAVLLLAVLVPALIGGPGFFPSPAADPANEIGMFHSIVGDLPDAAAVLVVFDYQPGYAGEMEQTAGAVLDHLMTKNARLAFVSGSPTGVLMNERLITAQNKRRGEEDQYKKGINYIDLGYLPGDAAGIQVFAEKPRLLGIDYEVGDLWTVIPGLNDIDALSDFAAAIVITDNPDTGRMWIEQASRALGTKPMLMVVSAQAGPMINPYYASEQIKGLVTGLAGGATYEAATQRPDGAGKYWNSYGAGMIAAELLIFLGGIWALIKHLQTRQAVQSQEEDEA